MVRPFLLSSRPTIFIFLIIHVAGIRSSRLGVHRGHFRRLTCRFALVTCFFLSFAAFQTRLFLCLFLIGWRSGSVGLVGIVVVINVVINVLIVIVIFFLFFDAVIDDVISSCLSCLARLGLAGACAAGGRLFLGLAKVEWVPSAGLDLEGKPNMGNLSARVQLNIKGYS